MFGSVFYDNMDVEVPHGSASHNKEFLESNDQLLRGFNELKKSELAGQRALQAQRQQPGSRGRLGDSIDAGAEEGAPIVKEAPQLTLQAYRVLKDINDSEERGLVLRVLFDIFRQIREGGLEVAV